MQYREIVAITGLGGLYQLIASKQDGAIVKSLEDKSSRFVSSRVHNFTPLESIEVFTTGDNVNLVSVFKAMDEQATTEQPNAKADNNAVKAYFKTVFPTFDEERVYVSDMKKMVKWYSILKANDLLKFDEIMAPETATEEDAPVTAVEASSADEKAAKQPKAKKAEVSEGTVEASVEKPKKVTKPKAAAAPVEGEEATAPKPKKAAVKKKKEEE
ncbi:hypothetical protein GA0116948_102357 [Chitinophaga costaii]|uniref:Uncharacterized protein n=1 Tax=Chitinophaga costaii TaxID=1335309 RepID=A0A1C4AZF3_9BACT|nr:DUF5606 domain-containing protein [Chitinophaga costaii]PUZ26812.1 hypothetical protein DCM91_10475 [Chitinophaga costaii]SCB99993.1 hypothetical protein GA0116948_102357 [Chitinophaga costaii]